MDTDTKDFDAKISERFAQLPKVIQDAITSADVQKRMRALADTQKLHIDQWEALENEVMLTLLGFELVEDLEKNIKSNVKVTDDVAKALTEEISKIVFEPVRQELERQLEHPDAKAAETSGVDAMRKDILSTESGAPAPNQAQPVPSAPPVVPATPPAAPNQEKVQRAPISETYKPGQTSTERKEVHEDPYRELPA